MRNIISKGLLVKIMMGAMFVFAASSPALAQNGVAYPNTVIRAPTEQERIDFRWRDLCRQNRAGLMDCLRFKEQAKREVLGPRYNPPKRLSPWVGLLNHVLWTTSELDPPNEPRQVPRNPPYRQRPARR